ncbi:MAG: histidine kinase, partial [Nitriliruptorales bacterium]|nr:histidine kinase [Nitriliruptorales bacterium]
MNWLDRFSDKALVRGGKLAAVATAVAIALAGIVLIAAADLRTLYLSYTLHNMLGGLFVAVLMYPMVEAQPRNAVVWLLGLVAVLSGVQVVTGAAAAAAAEWVVLGLDAALLVDAPPGLTVADLPLIVAVPLWINTWVWVPILFALFLSLVYFPVGALPSRRWRWVPWTVALGTALMVGAFAHAAFPTMDTELANFEADFPGLEVFVVGFGIGGAGSLGAITSLFPRYRRASGDERYQIRWLGFGGGVLVLSMIVTFTIPLLGLPSADVSFDDYFRPVGLVTFGVLLCAYAVAILKYRLYDIDVVISRTVAFGVLAGFITVVYAAIVVGLGSLLGGGDEPSLWLSIGATALVAVIFEPVRAAVTRWTNRLVFGRRATPYEVLSELTARLSEVAGSEEALERLAGLVADGTGASRSGVWLRVGDELRLAASAPEQVEDEMPVVVLAGEGLPELPGDVVEPVAHQGELLGAISVDKARSDTVTPADERLVADAAAGASLLLRNLRLNAELADRAAELRASRRRLVASHDEARRKLERDLHDGAQQEVVALKVKLGLARTLAQREGADELVPEIEQLADATQHTVETMRTIARGIYPPLLEAEGLAPAITAAANQTPVAVSLDLDTELGRFPRELEATCYFTVLEALRLATHTHPTTITIRLTHTDHHLTATITHHQPDQPLPQHTDGLTHAHDRTTALDGHLTTTDNTITATLPTRIPV